MSNRIVITGLGPISSLGVGKDAMWKGFLQGDCGIGSDRMLVEGDEWERFSYHKVKDFRIENFNLDLDKLEKIREWRGGEHNKDLLFFLAAIQLALNDAAVFNSDDLAVVVTHENLGLEQLLWKMFDRSYHLLRNKNLKKIDYFNALYNEVVKLGYETQDFMGLFHIAKFFNIHKYSIFNNNACASGQFALEIAKDIINSKKARTVVVVAGDCPDVFKYKWFKSLNMYPGDLKTKPFDVSRNGFLLGEGAVAFVLEGMDEAKKRKTRIYAEYLGSAFRLESWGVMTPKVGLNYYDEVILESLHNAKINKKDIDFICAHGVATPVSDYYEAKAISRIFKHQNTPVTALKPYVGHNLGGSNLMEIAMLLLAMRNDCIPPILNTNHFDESLQINIVSERINKKVDVVMKLCCAFAGYDAATILRKME